MHPESRAFATCLMVMVVLVTALFYLVHHSHGGIRGATWMTLNMTISIFAAVLIYGSLLELLRELFEIQTMTGMLLLLFALFVVLLCCMQGLLYAMAKYANESSSEAVCVIWAHIAGFAAMYCGAGMQAIPAISENGFMLVGHFVVMTGVLLAVILIASRLRKAAAMADGILTDEEEAWMDYVEEVENDVVSLCVGFCAMQITRYIICEGELQPYEPKEGPEAIITQTKANLLLLVSVVAGAVNFASTKYVTRAVSEGEHSPLQLRLLKLFQATAATALAWSLLFWGEWQVYISGFDGGGSRIEACIVTALVLTVVALVVVLLLDAIAGFVLHTRSSQRGLRSLLLSMGLMVGFTWERAFDLGLEHLSVTHGGAWAGVLKHVTPWVMVGIVVPAWAWYILPKAKEAEEALGEEKL